MLFFKKWGQFPRGFPAEATPFLPPYCTFDACAVCRSLLVLECEVGRVFSTPTSFNRSEHANLSQKRSLLGSKASKPFAGVACKSEKKMLFVSFFPFSALRVSFQDCLVFSQKAFSDFLLSRTSITCVDIGTFCQNIAQQYLFHRFPIISVK